MPLFSVMFVCVCLWLGFFSLEKFFHQTNEKIKGKKQNSFQFFCAKSLNWKSNRKGIPFPKIKGGSPSSERMDVFRFCCGCAIRRKMATKKMSQPRKLMTWSIRIELKWTNQKPCLFPHLHLFSNSNISWPLFLLIYRPSYFETKLTAAEITSVFKVVFLLFLFQFLDFFNVFSFFWVFAHLYFYHTLNIHMMMMFINFIHILWFGSMDFCFCLDVWVTMENFWSFFLHVIVVAAVVFLIYNSWS